MFARSDRRLARVLVASTLLVAAGCQHRASDRVQVAPAPPPRADLVTVLGLCEDYPEESRSLARAQADLERARAAGARVLRIAFGWDAMEPSRGTYDWSFWDEFVPLAVESYGLRLIPYVCYTPAWAASEPGPDHWRSPPRDPADFERFMQALVARYRPWINSWEIWNEPDNPAYWTGDVAAYAELLRAGRRGVRAADPAADVVLGGIAWDLDFLAELLDEHAGAREVEVVNVHSYFETWHEEPLEALPAYLDEAAALIAAHGEGEPLWMAEVGYSSLAGQTLVGGLYRPRFAGEHTPDHQAAALARTVLLSLGTGHLSLFAWYRINDLPPTQEVIGDTNNRHLGLFAADGRPHPSLPVFTWLADRFRRPYQPAGITPAPLLVPAGVTVEQRSFRFDDGRWLVGVWFPTPSSPPPADAPLIRDPRATSLRLAAGWRVVDRHVAPTRSGPPRPPLSLHGGEVLLLLLEREPTR